MTNQALKLVASIKPEAVLDEVVRYRQIHRQIKLLEAEQAELAKLLKEGYFATNETYEYEGELLMTCKLREENRFDGKKFKEDHPELDKQYRVISQVKVLRVI